MPIYRFEIDSPFPTQEITAQILRLLREPLKSIDSLDPNEFLGSFYSFFAPRDNLTPPFRGSVDGDSFQIRRNIGGRNSFQPLIRGRIISTPSASHIKVTVSLHPFTGAFCLLWLCVLGYFAWGCFYMAAAAQRSQFSIHC